MLPWWHLGRWSARRPGGESCWGEWPFPGCAMAGEGGTTANTKQTGEGPCPSDRESEGRAQRGGLSSLFFSLVEYNVMNSARGPAPPFNILSAEQGFLWQPGEPGEP